MLEPSLPLRTVLDRALDRLRGISLAQWLLIVALVLVVVQTVRIEGAQLKLPLLGAIGPQGWKPRALEAEATIKRISEAQDEAERRARDAKASEEAALKELAKGNDDATVEKLQDELDRARAYAARNRVRPKTNQGAACGPVAASPDRSAGHDEPTSGAPELDETGYVAIPEEDVMICTRNTVLAEQWREWGLALEKRGE